jgi:hypothetical protein
VIMKKIGSKPAPLIKTLTLISFLILAPFGFLSYSAQIIVNPGDSIQTAIDSANDKDEIIVNPGTYVGFIQFKGKDIILRSSDPTDPSTVESTIIDANNGNSCVFFTGTEPATTKLAGFTLTNGKGWNGGGIAGTTSGTGTGPLATIENNIISSNTAYSGTGGGIWNCDGLIQNNIITANKTTAYNGHGGGIVECDGTIRNNIISYNEAAGGGTSAGGGVYNCQGLIENNIIVYNCATLTYGRGAGIYYCGGTIQNNIVAFNVARSYAGLDECDGTISNNTIYGNEATDNPGGGLAFCNGIIRSNIIWGNIAPSDPQLYYCADSPYPAYNCVEGGTYGTGNISSNPLLADPGNLDFHIPSNSPCVDAGGTTTLAMDFEGDPRPYDGTATPRGDGSDIDIGADEFYIPPTPTPTPTPSPTPTETPVETPTPPPTPWRVVFDFTTDREDWTSTTVPGVFSEPDFVFDPDYLKIISRTNTNCFGYWKSPDGAVGVEAGYLYRARFNVSTNLTDQSLVPQIRLRANSSNLQQSDYITIESSGDGGASPTSSGTEYDLYFVPPANDTFLTLAFDLLNFNPLDSASAELALDSVIVNRFELSSLPTASTVQTYEFSTYAQGWTTGGSPIVFTMPTTSHTNGALQLQATNNTDTFGYWQSASADVTVASGLLYRGTFEIRTDVTDQSLVPQMRLRFNTANLQASRTLGIESTGDGANSPGVTNTTYDNLYFLPPANSAGEGLIVSFDMLNFDPNDAANGSIILDSATIETLSPPSSP